MTIPSAAAAGVSRFKQPYAARRILSSLTLRDVSLLRCCLTNLALIKLKPNVYDVSLLRYRLTNPPLIKLKPYVYDVSLLRCCLTNLALINHK